MAVPEVSERALRNLGVLSLLKPNERIYTVGRSWQPAPWPMSALWRTLDANESRERNFSDIREEIAQVRRQAQENQRLAASLADKSEHAPAIRASLEAWNARAKERLVAAVDGLYQMHQTVYCGDAAAQSFLADIESTILDCVPTDPPTQPRLKAVKLPDAAARREARGPPPDP